MIRYILLAAVAGVGALGAFVATRPDTMHVERTADVAAPADVVYAEIVDFHRWAAWSPWDAMDPQMKKTYQGVDGQKGASYAWDGNDQVGRGTMTLTELSPSSKVGIKLDFEVPFEAHNQVTIALTSQGDKTHVVWSMDAPQFFVTKALGLVMDMDAMIGKDFEKGLQKLGEVAAGKAADAKRKAEEEAKAQAAAASAVQAADAALKAAAAEGAAPVTP